LSEIEADGGAVVLLVLIWCKYLPAANARESVGADDVSRH